MPCRSRRASQQPRRKVARVFPPLSCVSFSSAITVVNMADMSPTSHLSAESKGRSIVVTICIIVGISTLFVLGRLFVRTKILGKAHLDDHLTFLSLVSVLIYLARSLTLLTSLLQLLSYVTVGLEIWAVQSGNGRHVGTLSTEQQSAAVLSTISGFPPNVLAYTVPKFAVVALLVRILNPGRVHCIVLWSLATVCLVLVLLCIIILFAQCTPSRAQWDFTITDKSCWSPWVLINVAILTGGKSFLLRLADTELHRKLTFVQHIRPHLTCTWQCTPRLFS